MQVRDEMSAEAAARQQALGGLRKHVGDELKATQRGVASKLEKTDKELAAHEQALAKLERALAMVKEDVTGEKDSREALKMTLSHAIEVVGDPTRRGEVVDGTALVLTHSLDDAHWGCCVLSTQLGDARATPDQEVSAKRNHGLAVSRIDEQRSLYGCRRDTCG